VTGHSVAVVNSDLVQQRILCDAVERLGFTLVLNAPTARLSSELIQRTHADVWLLTVQDDDVVCSESFDQLLNGDVPVLVGMDAAPDNKCTSFLRWEKKLLAKLRYLTNTPAPAATVGQFPWQRRSQRRIELPEEFLEIDRQVPVAIFVLGASLGGPEAVKEFLDVLPAGLPVAFVYAQHIDERFEQALRQAVGRHSAYKLSNVEDVSTLCCGDVLIAPVSTQFNMTGLDYISTSDKAWNGPYGPSIDGVINLVYNHAKRRFGCILFSGMGSDGSESISAMPKGTQIWVQNPAGCGNASMPESAINTGCVTYVGDAYQLACRLTEYVRTVWIEDYERKSNHQCG
tara:strand:- start:4867 stop:5898 length:1032 start_codon:yes stop_codon:yes gene_type:complete